MLVLGHVGITFGAAVAAEALSPRFRNGWRRGTRRLLPIITGATASLRRHVDLRFLLVGSLLPDIIDKPVGLLLFADELGNGRIYCHALVFPAALAIGGMVLYRARGWTHALVLAYGSMMHLVLDAMWRTPATLLWPFAGPMPRGDIGEYWLSQIITTLLTNPAAYVPEIAGAILLAPLLWAILRNGGLMRFLRSGVVD